METLKRWAINIVQVIVAIFVIGFGMHFIWYWVNAESYAETFADTLDSRDPVVKFLVRCESLWEAIELDSQCLDAAPGCTLTRDELATAKKRVKKYELFCTND